MDLHALLRPGRDGGAEQHVVAYSGGLDSTVLLHLAAEAGLPGLQAVHVHHGLQAPADEWAQRCADLCAQLRVPLTVERVQIASDDPLGPEAAARAARYAALAKHVSPGGVLLTAHHEQDQAETLLLRLLRGTGVEGMAAMRERTAFAGGQLWRPLLGVSKTVLRAYALAQGLHWITDPHNSQERYTRSWLRAQVLPVLRERVPQVDALLVRAALHAQEAATTLAEVAEQDCERASLPDGALSIPALLALRPARRHAALRCWLRQRQLPLPYAATLARLEPEVFAASVDAEPLLAWPGGEFRRYRDRLYASAPLPPVPREWSCVWDGRGPLQLPPGCGQLLPVPPLAVAAAMTVRFAAGGERIKPAGDAHTRTLKYLGQTAGIPPWVRRRMPLIYAGGVLCSMAGIWATAGAPGVRWQAAHLPHRP